MPEGVNTTRPSSVAQGPVSPNGSGKRTVRRALLGVAVLLVAGAGALWLVGARGSSGNELVLEMEPVDLPAGASHHDAPQPMPLLTEVPQAGWLHGYSVEVVDAQGRLVPPEVLHHVNIITPDRRELFSHIMLRLGASGKETGEVRLPWFLGHPIEAEQGILVVAMLHNPTDRSYDGVRVRVRMPFRPRGGLIRPISVFPMYMDVMPPASVHAYDMPPGKSAQYWEGSPAVPGRLLGLGGHLHKYGERLVLEDVTEGRVLWEARPVIDETGEVIAMPKSLFPGRFGIYLDPSHTYRLTAEYDNPTGELIPLGAMGALGGVFKPARGHEWPAPQPDHPEFLLDVQLVTSGDGYGSHDHGAMEAGGHDHGAMEAEVHDHDAMEAAGHVH